MNFSSKTWLDLQKISLFTAAGYRTVAINLPGFGNSDKLPVDNIENKSKFMLIMTERFNRFPDYFKEQIKDNIYLMYHVSKLQHL